jgi:CubicO group peptidase (beta-lactamase class C family)
MYMYHSDQTATEAIAMFNAPVELPRSPNSGPLYSNLGFNLLGMALERVHGSTYEDIIQRLIIEPLDLSDTSFEMPNTTDNALLPGPGEEHWLVGDYGNFNPTGGLWSTPKDIMTFMRAILDNRLLSAADTRKWLQPQSLTSSIHQLVGAPWELYRPDNHETAFKRPIDIFTKAGGVTGYGAYAVVVPEYDLILTINAAGNSSEAAARTLLPSMMQKLIPWADQIARAEAEAHYAGRYSLRNDSSVTVALDEGPGLALSEWNMNGVDVLQSVSGLLGGGVPFSARIYPTDPDSQETNKQFWRIHLSGPEIETDWADYGCSTWTELDRFRYIQQQIDAVYFVVDGGEVRAIEFPGWRMSLKRDA